MRGGSGSGSMGPDSEDNDAQRPTQGCCYPPVTRACMGCTWNSILLLLLRYSPGWSQTVG